MDLNCLKHIENERYKIYKEIESIDVIKDPCSFEYFLKNYLLLNKPCIFDSWLTKNWKATKEWIIKDTINYEFLNKEFGS